MPAKGTIACLALCFVLAADQPDPQQTNTAEKSDKPGRLLWSENYESGTLGGFEQRGDVWKITTTNGAKCTVVKALAHGGKYAEYDSYEVEPV